jgi:hypothetical protein
MYKGLKEGAEMPIEKKEEAGVDNTIRQAWNDYVSWLDTKGMKGKPELDKDDLGGKMIDLYRKENPKTPIRRELIVPIQKEFSKYRDWSLDQVKQGKIMLAEGVTPDNFMKHLSVVDGIPGQRTTSFSFPNSYLETYYDGKKIKKEDTGFSTATP